MTPPGPEHDLLAGGRLLSAVDDHTLAAWLAVRAGTLLLDIRAQGGREGDRQSNDLLLRLLAMARPDDAVLSEESADDLARLGRERVWIVDPLDGTREYGEPPRTDWAVHVALAIRGRPAVGAVALPAAARVLHTGAPPVLPPSGQGPIRLTVSRSRPPACVEHLVRHLDAQLVPMGSAGAKAMAVVRGEADVYAHSGGQYEWDSCAPVAVAAAAGLHVSRLDGSPLLYNQPSPYLPDVLICHPAFADRVLDVLRDS
ncbi:3'(2'),5'-bisphosphate nucleotidase CysQ [Frankia sp. AgB1.9]|uniref:3'(2'),5'-bisphosphate nucleotidase CysQ n=1 Tax=unclassified Frankia TaxID=2632575 RepID=UPI001932E194|nr:MULTISPECIES: 3'(2'),5'-bisphosphate nucleotidase CysQ [unclassified Frankia]MBL7493555.1 3'(2'),5'-bisphosphate nucleotidase CysQ [Frankia sp. AgW1.1]MBL7549816.1 3'(2'),5'-bisphosphate nucleotidase CysQ [Frankia sp. AgB1.9]MBL7622428.1 3'(2'),5'-bisphosphate nucleotidase CysQ [Frankia sp. AgB1.8]